MFVYAEDISRLLILEMYNALVADFGVMAMTDVYQSDLCKTVTVLSRYQTADWLPPRAQSKVVDGIYEQSLASHHARATMNIIDCHSLRGGLYSSLSGCPSLGGG